MWAPFGEPFCVTSYCSSQQITAAYSRRIGQPFFYGIDYIDWFFNLPEDLAEAKRQTGGSAVKEWE
jgi:hypothetical protein